MEKPKSVDVSEEGDEQVPKVSPQACLPDRLETPEVLQPAAKRRNSWAADKMNRLKTGSTSEVPPRSTLWATANPIRDRAQNAPCKFYSQAGGCRNGVNCRFLHTSGAASSNSWEHNAPSREATRSVRTDSDPDFQPTADLRSENRNLVQIPARDASSLSMNHLRYWLQQQLEQPASTNIEDLSYEDTNNRRIFVSILERSNLSELVVDKLVELLTKDEIRSSMMRHDTDRIYGPLMGSLFMVQLQSQIQGLVNPTPRKVHRYVRLVEELLERTSDGWTEVPLDAIKRVVDDMKLSNGRDTALDDLLEDVNRLLEQRDKYKRLKAVSNDKHICQGQDVLFRLPILPSDAEMEISDIVSRPLPVNQVGRRYSSVPEYLETHFQLYREDYIEYLRQGINAYKKRQTGSPDLDEENQYLNMYLDVKFVHGLKFGREDIERQVEFRVPGGKDIDWESSKRLWFGSLLCVSEDEFQTFFWALVVGRQSEDLARGRVTVRLITESDFRATHTVNSESCEPSKPTTGGLWWFDGSQRFIMAESPSAYFEAYSHVLKCLQREDMCRHLVFTKHLIDLEPKVGPPSYLARRPQHGEFNFRTVFPELVSEIGRDSFDILTSWPEWKNCALDDSQKKALKHGLTKELALIQGAPGTGKTYVGLLLVKALLANLKTQEYTQDSVHNQQDVPGPILVVSNTNHGLDQFLLGIYEFEKRLVRLGRSKHSAPALTSQSLPQLVVDQRQARSVDRSHSRASRAARDETKRLEPIIKEKFLSLTNLMFVNQSVLRGIATPGQVQSLFRWKNPAAEVFADEDIVQIWLAGSEFEVDFLEASGNRKNEKSTRGTTQRVSDSVNKFDLVRGKRGDNVSEHDAEYGEDWIQPEDDEGLVVQRQAVDGGTVSHIAFTNVSDVWKLSTPERLRLHEHWMSAIKKDSRDQIERLSTEYKEACKQSLRVEKEVQLALLRQAKVVGMTTTAGARLHDLLVSLKPTIVVVQDANEVLESSVLACLSPHTKHLILIGDHEQLRPLVSAHTLAVNNNLDVSLLERLVRSGVEFRRLEVQRRMRASISELLQCRYPNLRDHASVIRYPDVRGVKANVFLLDHKAEESSSPTSETGSKVNKEEAAMVVEFCLYLLNQGCYLPADITILSMYSGQVLEIKRLLQTRIEERWRTRIIAAEPNESEEKAAASGNSECPRVSTVDDFQGEESNIILLSLVRSNYLDDKEGPGKMDFLKIPNRACVAISRARIGLYMFGNAELLAGLCPLWRTIIGTLAESNSVGSHLYPVLPEPPRKGDHLKWNAP